MFGSTAGTIVTIVTEVGHTGGALERTMTETLEHETITEALTIIDESLARLAQRDLVSSTEVSNLLLDVRLLLAEMTIPEPEPVSN